MTLETDISTTLNCSNLAASELSTHGQKLAESLAKLTASYSTDHLIESRTIADKLDMYAAKKSVKQGYGLLGRLGHAKASILPAPVKIMWLTWLETGQNISNFRSVCRAHSLPVDDRETLTTLLEILHNANQLSQPEQVIEGRSVYNTLIREKQICESLGLVKDPNTSFWNNRQWVA